MDPLPRPKADHRRHRRIQGLVVVEGKTDEAKVARLFPGTDTLSVGGSAISEKTLNLIRAAAAKTRVVLLFDPDHQGEKIRAKVAAALTNFAQAFVDPKCFEGKSGKRGIAEAPDASVAASLTEFAVECDSSSQTLSWGEYLEAGLGSKQRRLMVCGRLGIGYANHKQLFKRLNLIGVDGRRLKELTRDA